MTVHFYILTSLATSSHLVQICSSLHFLSLFFDLLHSPGPPTHPATHPALKTKVLKKIVSFKTISMATDFQSYLSNNIALTVRPGRAEYDVA